MKKKIPISPISPISPIRFVAVLLLLLLCLPFEMRAQALLHVPQYYVGRAENFMQAGSWQEMKREVDEGLKEYPDNPNLRYLNGRYFYMARNLQEARYNFVRAIQEDDQHFKAKRMLVDVEDDLKHYSSAICYINELLEFQPYDRDLWRRKIGIYRKMGNHSQADALLQRLALIYPNDTVVRHELRNSTRGTWNDILLKSTLEESAHNLEKWIDLDPMNLSYYEELVSVYERMGEYERALGAVNRGLYRFPRNMVLVHKGLGIMTSMGLYAQALNFAKQHGADQRLYASLLQEVVDDARLRDPYESNGRLFELTGSQEALTYLLNTSLTRGYLDDARMYLGIAMKRDGRSIKLLAKLYGLEKRCGNEQAALRVLNEMAEKSPLDEEVNLEYAELMIELASKEMETAQWPEAYKNLEKALSLLTPQDDAWAGAVARQITVLGRMGDFIGARDLYKKMAPLTKISTSLRFGSAYEEAIANHLKVLLEEQRYEEALMEGKELLDVVYNSEAALRCCINAAQSLHRDGDFQAFAQQGYDAYPNTPYFIIKQAMSLRQQGRNAEALEMLQLRDEYDEWMNPQLIVAFSGVADEWANDLIKSHMPDVAVEVVDRALLNDPTNKALLYTKGLALENMKEWEQAYALQSRNYDPSNAEQQSWYEHMRYLGFRSMKNRIDASYTHAVYDSRSAGLVSTAHLYSIASVAYSRLEKRDSYTGQISYKGIDGYHVTIEDEDESTYEENEAGGTGLEFMGQWEHSFNHRWTGMASVSYGTRFFNKLGVNLSASYAMDDGWTPSLRLSYRRTPKTYLFIGTDTISQAEYGKYHLFMLAPSIEKAWERIRVTGNADLSLLKGSVYYNIGLKGKLFINDDNVSSISLVTGFGSFPELQFFEQTALRGLSHTNTMIGFDAQYLCTNNFCLGLTGSWNTCYNPYRQENGQLGDSYRNIYSIMLQAHVAF